MTDSEIPAVHDPIREAGPYLVEMRTAGFRLYRRSDEVDDPDAGEYAEQLLIEPGELPDLRAVLLQVWAHPTFAGEQWDVTRAWLTAERYTQEELDAANEDWAVTRTAAAVVIEGPMWTPTVYPSGAFTTEIEFARLEELLAALGEV